jgi:hypothetical protein
MAEKVNGSMALSVIDGVEIQEVHQTMTKIAQFQKVVQQTLKQNHDFGVIPGTPKPTMLKPGAEKIFMLLGLSSEFEIVDSTRDFEKGFFQYQVRCKLFKGDVMITQGLGACNTREPRYQKQNPFGLDNTILKMAKKRAMVDAALLVASLSDVFTQDLEDMDLAGDRVSTAKKHVTDQDGTIPKAQAKRMFALAGGNAEIVKEVIAEHGYERTDQIKKTEYDKLCKEIEAKRQELDKELEGFDGEQQGIDGEPEAEES